MLNPRAGIPSAPRGRKTERALVARWLLTCYAKKVHAASRLPPRLIDPPGARLRDAGEGAISDCGGVPFPLRHRSGLLPGRGLKDRTNVECDSRRKLSSGKHVDRYHDQFGGRELEASRRGRFDQCHGKRRYGHRTSIACALALFALSGAAVPNAGMRRASRAALRLALGVLTPVPLWPRFRIPYPTSCASPSIFTVSCAGLVDFRIPTQLCSDTRVSASNLGCWR